MKQMIYIGDDKRLEGKTALTRKLGSKFLAQFDDITLNEAFGWAEFDKSDFVTVGDIREMKSLIEDLYMTAREKQTVNQHNPYTWSELNPELFKRIGNALKWA